MMKHHSKNFDIVARRRILSGPIMRYENLPRKVLFGSLILNATFIFALIPYHIEVNKNVAISETKPEIIVVEKFEASVSAYTSRAEETDNTPFITANGDHVYSGGVACPSRYKFGTKVLIDGKTFKCNDRMNKRYRDGNYFDVWFQDYDLAVEHGRRQVEISIVE